MDDHPGQPFSSRRRRLVKRTRLSKLIFIIVVIAGLSFDLAIALSINKDPLGGDAKVYSRIALNVIDHGVFSPEEQPDKNGEYRPSLIRLPGYPLFLTTIYSLAGKENYPAVRTVQGVLHFLSALMAALIAYLWTGGRRRRRWHAMLWTFVLAAFCPFTANYSAMLLTEVPTIFFMTAMMLSATLAIKTDSLRSSLLWWAVAGLAGGLAVEMRPDSGLFSLSLGLTLVVVSVALLGLKKAFLPVVERGLAFSTAFILVLTPWTIRNERVFGIFQPIAPQYAAAQDEFVPKGYFHWLRTWVDDFKYVSPTQWELEIHRIDINKLPPTAFDSDEERARVAQLIDAYNTSDPDHPMQPPQKPSANSDDSDDNDDSADSDDGDSGDDDSNDDENADQEQELNLHISPEVDGQFEAIARERVARDPFRYYAVLPAERAATMWFDTHSDFYPFSGALLPVTDLDTSIHQDIWLPLFALIDLIYTLFAIAGFLLLLIGRWPRARIWAFMAFMIAATRVVLFSTLENPEPRYLIELFFIAAILGGIALSCIQFVREKGSIGVQINYGRRTSTTN